MKRATTVLGLAALLGGTVVQADERRNYFDDPFLQATHGLAACPAPRGPAITEEEMKAQAHDRAQRGTSCWLAGRCRLHNAYLYDKEIAPRAVKAILADGRFASGTSVWILGQRRQVFLQGCVGSKEDAEALRRLVGNIDDVEGVVDQLMVGTGGTPPYPAAGR
jgi:osmotically-inducible protein OsmY